MNTKDKVLNMLFGRSTLPLDECADIAQDIEAIYIEAVKEIELTNIRRIKRDIARFKIKVLRLKAGAYCVECKRYYTFEEWDSLPTERICSLYMAFNTVCECGSKRWTYIG